MMNKELMTEPKHNSDIKLINPTSSPAIGNTPVVGSTVYLMDCVAGMKEYADKWFDLAVVDPEYGLGISKRKFLGGDSNGNSYAIQKGGNVLKVKNKGYKQKDWDENKPTADYFKELLRVSKNQIVFGANHFVSLIPFDSSCWIIWDKDNTGNYADAELAYTSFKTSVRIFKYRWNGMIQQDMSNKEKRIHPTQKPVALYDWIFKNYASKEVKILDTHLGSGSSRIAADKAGLDFTGFEIDKDYYDLGEKRFKQYKSQLRIEGW